MRNILGYAKREIEDLPRDQRSENRFTLLLQSAKLVCDGCEFLCILRDISQSGVRVSLYHSLPESGSYHLELFSGDRFGLRHVWSHGSEAGFSFSCPISVEQFIQTSVSAGTSGAKVNIDWDVELSFGSRIHPARIQSLSRTGVQILTDTPLPLHQLLTLSTRGMPQKLATVVGRKMPVHHLAFAQSFTFECLAMLTYRLQAARLSEARDADLLFEDSSAIRRFAHPPHCRTCNYDCPQIQAR